MHPESTLLAEPAPAAIDRCWSRIGVRGDGSCPLLLQHVHCRNCPTHAAAAAALLDRKGPSDYLAECSRHVAQAIPVRQADADSAVVFRIGAEWLALPTPVLREVVALRAIHALPNRRDGVVQGVANVRGELLVCVSIAAVLGLAHATGAGLGRQGAALRRLVVLGLDGRGLGFVVDDIHGIHRFDPCTLTPVPATVAQAAASYSRAVLPWRDHAIGLLDEQLLFHTLRRSLS
jgi:chemotaxis-related protein WspD